MLNFLLTALGHEEVQRKIIIKSCGSSLMPGNFWKLKSSPKALLYHANVPEINQVSDYDLLNFVQWNSMTIKIF